MASLPAYLRHCSTAHLKEAVEATLSWRRLHGRRAGVDGLLEVHRRRVVHHAEVTCIVSREGDWCGSTVWRPSAATTGKSLRERGGGSVA